MLKKCTIYGERCSGTNYLENIIKMNFNVDITWKYGWKHFFGFQDKALKNSDDTLFLCIVRNLPDWINSFYRAQHHLHLRYRTNLSPKKKLDIFLNKEIYSVEKKNIRFKRCTKEIMTDRNIYTGKRYKNIFELRHTKIKWMLEDLPNKVKHHLFIRYEDLVDDFKTTLLKIKDMGLQVKDDTSFPKNTLLYKKSKKKFIVKKNIIPTEFILKNPNVIPLYENKLYDNDT